MAQGATLPPLSLGPLKEIAGWFSGDPTFGNLPKQKSGTAAGRGHSASFADTHANGGAGRGAGKGKGELDESKPFDRKATAGQSAGNKKGFDPQTSTRVPEKSDERTDYFTNADGTFSRKVSSAPINYKDSHGAWQPIDPRLSKQADGRFHQNANALSVDFAAQAADGALASFGVDADHVVAYGLKGAAPVAGQASGAEVDYPAVLPGTDLKLVSSASSVKEDLTLHSADAANSWVFPLDLKGLMPVLNKDGSIALQDAKGNTQAEIPASYAYDAKVDPKSGDHASTHNLKYELITDGGKPALRLTLDASWLHDSARVFPVTVDPSVWDNVKSTYVESGSDVPQVDHSMEQTIKVGSWDSGTHSANSFVQEWRYTFDGSGVSLVSAHLWLYDVWASTCTPEPFSVSLVSQPWTPSTTVSYPGPSFGAAIGTLTPTVSHACANTSGSSTGGDWVVVPLDNTAVQNLANGTTPDYGFAVSAPTNDPLHWKQFGSQADPGDAPYVVYDYTGNIPPQVEATFPANNSPVMSATPELQAFADFQGGVTTKQYDFTVYDTTSTVVADSGLVNSPDWVMPAGKVKWGQAYFWTVRAYDGTNYSPYAPWSAFTVQVPQPLITSSLSQDGGQRGFDPSVGNFTKEIVDAHVDGMGPVLDVVRDYNSRDFRTAGAFGSGWSSIFDARATEKYDANNNLIGVVVTYPDGSQVGFGKNSDGTFSSPQGRFASLRSVTGGYTLTDKKATVYTFTQGLGPGAYGITAVADADQRAVNFTWTTGQITKMTSAVSGRSLNLTWSTPTGATAPHVATVVTDPVTAGQPATALTWTYSYTSDQLTKLCSPVDTTTCSQYTYTSGSQHQTQVLDAGAYSLWQFNEASGTTAASAVGLNEGSDNATYSNVTLGQAGPLAGTNATAAGFNGTSSYVELPKSLVSSSTQQTMSMWFKTTTAPGVLFSYSTRPISDGSTLAQYTPGIYVGTDGKLNAEFWYASGVAPMVSSTAVNDGNWHQVTLAGAGSNQTLYLDGNKVGSATGMISYSNGYQSSLQSHSYVGAGFLGGTWPDEPNYSTTSNTGTANYFNGTIGDVAFYQKGLTPDQVASIYSAGKNASSFLTSVTRPSGKTFATATYDTNSGRVQTVADANGANWTLGTPSIAGSSQVYRSSVLGSGPAGYWRLGDSAGATNAFDEVNYGKATYNNVTLGQGGPFADSTAAKFDGTSSYVRLPATDTVGAGNNSIEMWFNMPAGNTNGGVLFDYAGAAVDGANPRGNSWVPALYVGTDGKLHGKFWDQYTTAWQIVSGPVNDGKWHHVVLAANSGKSTLYLDGTSAGNTVGTRQFSPSDYVYIGAGESYSWPNAPTNERGYFPGLISDVAFYRTELSGNDVAAHYAASKNSMGLTPVETVNVTEPGNQTLAYQYDPYSGYRTLSDTDGLGNKTSFGYDTGGFLYTTTDPNGSVTTTGHDVRGNTVSTTSCQNQAQGTCSTRYFTYWPDDTTAVLTTPDARNDVMVTDRDPRSSSATDNTYLTSYGYDSAGNQTTVTSPAVAGFPNGRTATTTYSDGTATYPAADSGNVPAGLPVKTTSPGGAVNTISYFHNGDVASTVDAAGLKNTFTYDNLGRALTKTVTSDAYPNGLTTSYSYDGIGKVATQTDPTVTDQVTGAIHTAKITTVYDADDNITSQTVADTTGGDASRTESTTYDQYDRVASQTDANGNAGYTNGATTRYTYDARGNLYQETDAAGNVRQYAYDSNNHLLSQSLLSWTGDPTSPSTATTLVESSRAYDPAGRLASLADSMGNTTYYTYLDDGHVATVTKKDSTGSNSFTVQSNVYDAAGNLTQRTGNNGANVTTYQVDAASRVTSTAVDPNGVNRVTTESFTPDDLVATTNQHDSSGFDRTTTSTYDVAGRMTGATLYGDASGHPNAWYQLNQSSGSTVTDNSGTGYTASVSGPVTWSNQAANFPGSGLISTNGPVLNTTSSYTLSAWVYLTDATTWRVAIQQGGTNTTSTNLLYDKWLGWSFESASSDSTSPSAYYSASSSAVALNAWTHLVGTFDSSNGSMKLYVNGALAGTGNNPSPWTGNGPLTLGNTMMGQLSNAQVYQRALSASEVATLYSNGRAGGTVGSSSTETTTYSYDQRGLAKKMIDPNGGETDYGYDEAGNRVMVSLPTTSVENVGGTAVQASPTTFTGFNTFGEPVEGNDALGNQTRHTYDADGRETSVIDPSYTPPGSTTPITPTTTQAYDNLGNLVSQTRADGKSTSYLFNQRSELVQETLPDTNKTHHTYDLNGEQLSVTDVSGATRQATYDWMGRQLTATTLERYPTAQTLTTTSSYAVTTGNPFGAYLSSETSPEGRPTTYAYNGAGDVSSVTDAAGNTTQYTYDFMGNRLKTIAPDNTWSEVDYRADGLPTLSKSYDASNNLLAQTSQVYDGKGNLLSSTDARGTAKTFTYDPTGMVTSETEPVTATSSITTSFGYNANGGRTRFTDGRNNVWKYTYNTWSKPESTIAPNTTTYTAASDATTTFIYDQLGQVTQMNLPGGVTQSMSYDVVGNLTSQSGSGAEAPTATRTFTYDNLGRVLTAATAAAGTVGQTGYQAATNETFTYNDRSQLLTAGGSAGSTTFGYTADGLMSSRQDTAGTTSYTYDNGGRLKTLADPATGNTLTYNYNSLNQPSSISYGASGQSRSFSYDNLHRLTGDTLTNGALTLASIAYGYDANGNLTSKNTTGVTGAANNTYTYDLANRLTSWNNGTANTAYAYDASGNRIQVGSNVFTYDQRDQLTSDGQHTYTYSARGTMTQDTVGGTPAVYASDAYNQQILAGPETYNLDASGRVITATTTPSGSRTFQYTGASNQVASDGTNTYTWDPGNGLIGVNTPGGPTTSGRLVMTDQHDDVVGQFGTGSTTLTGSRTYDPLGTVTATSGLIGQLGYQSGWTDSANNKVNMFSRWYNPANGQFLNKDTVSLSPVPNSASANPFAYGNDNPLAGTDPSGHCWSWAQDLCSIGNSIASGLSSAWNSFTSDVSDAWDRAEQHHPFLRAISNAATAVGNWAVSTAKSAVNSAKHQISSGIHYLRDEYHRAKRHLPKKLQNGLNRLRQAAANPWHAVKSAFNAGVAHAGKAVKAIANSHLGKLATAAVTNPKKFVKDHAAALTSMAVSAVVFAGCEAVLGAPTGGAGAIAGAAACGALAGEAGGAASQGVKCYSGKGSCSAKAFSDAMVQGEITGAIGGAVTGPLGCLAESALGGILPSIVTRAAAGAVSGAGSGAISGAASYGLSCSPDCSITGAANAAASGAKDGAMMGAVFGAVGKNPCAGPHSFTANTPVLMADSTTKPISEIKVGDKITNAVPDKDGTQTHTVTNIIVTTTDHDFVDLTVAPVSKTPAPAKADDTKSSGKWHKAMLGLAATAAAVTLWAGGSTQQAQAAEPPAATQAATTATDVQANGSTLTTTYHHPFYDETQHAFTEAKDLTPGDILQTPTGTAQITSLRLYHAQAITYDLTIGDLHTYYVEAGTTPVLVHNCGGSNPEHSATCDCANGSQPRMSDGTMGSNPNGPAAHSRDTEYPSQYRADTHEHMVTNFTDEGRAAGGWPTRGPSGEKVPRSELTWRDDAGNEIPFEDLTYDHSPMVVEHWNTTGYNSPRSARNDFFNETEGMTAMTRSANSSHGASSGLRYRQDTGSNYSR